MRTDVLLFKLSSEVTLFGRSAQDRTRNHSEKEGEARPTLTKVVLPVPPSPTIQHKKAIAKANTAGIHAEQVEIAYRSVKERSQVRTTGRSRRSTSAAPRTSLNVGICSCVAITRNRGRK